MPPPCLTVTLDLDESDRQIVLLALAVLSLRSPGLDYALNRVACRIDNVKAERAETYEAFRRARSDVETKKGMREHCRKCRRPRPETIADPTCPEGGYCDWVEGEQTEPARKTSER